MKRVLKVLIWSILYILLLIYMGKTTISFHPFFISMEEWDRVLMFVLFSVFDVIHTSIEYARGFNNGIEMMTCDNDEPEEK